MSTATSNAHDWRCEEHATYGWRGEACRKCPEAPSEITALREQVEKLKAELKSIDGALNDPRANLTLTTSEIIWELKGQVEKLTKELDEYKQILDTASTDNEKLMKQQLAALAKQNEKLKAERSSVWMVATKVCMMLFATKEDADQSQSQQGASTYTVPVEVPVFGAPLDDLASPILNKYRAEGVSARPS